MADFFKAQKMSLPDKKCPNGYVGRGRGGYPGFVFDPYEGRCMYDSRNGCGDGLAQIYNKLRAKLANRTN